MILGNNEWEIEAEALMSLHGVTPELARKIVILEWMSQGDFKPLAAAIREDGTLNDGHVLGMLVAMIEGGQLQAAHWTTTTTTGACDAHSTNDSRSPIRSH